MTQVNTFLPKEINLTVMLLIKVVAKRIGWISICSIAIGAAFQFYYSRLEKNNKEFKAETSNKSWFRKFKFKRILSLSYIMIWVAIALWSISLIDISIVISTLRSKQTAFFLIKGVGFMIGMSSYFVAFVASIVWTRSVLTTFFFSLILGAFIYTFSELKKPTGYLQVILDTVVAWLPTSIVDSIILLRTQTADIKKAFTEINSNIRELFPSIVYPSIAFTIQLVLIANAIVASNLSWGYLIPLLFLVEWAHNFSLTFTKSSIYTFKIRQQSSMKEIPENTTKKPAIHFLESFPDICLFSFQKTVFSIFIYPKRILAMAGPTDGGILFKIVSQIEKLETFFQLLFQVYEFYSEEALFNHALISAETEKENNLQYKEIAAKITHRVFKKPDVFLFTVLNFKNFAIKTTLHFAFISHFYYSMEITKKAAELGFPVGSESITFFGMIFKNISPDHILLMIFYLSVASYIVAIGSAYLMNKKNKSEQEIIEEETRRIDIKEPMGQKTILWQAIDILKKTSGLITNGLGLILKGSSDSTQVPASLKGTMEFD